MLAVTAMQKGMHPEDVADLYDVGRSTVYNWWKEYQEKGTAALTVKFSPGRTPRLTDKQRDQLRTWASAGSDGTVGSTPRTLGVCGVLGCFDPGALFLSWSLFP